MRAGEVKNNEIHRITAGEFQRCFAVNGGESQIVISFKNVPLPFSEFCIMAYKEKRVVVHDGSACK